MPNSVCLMTACRDMWTAQSQPILFLNYDRTDAETVQVTQSKVSNTVFI